MATYDNLYFGFDRIDRALASAEQRLEQAAVVEASDAGETAGLLVKRYEDGTLAPVEQTLGFTGSQIAFNRSARNAYFARQRLDSEARASELMRKHPLDPQAFKTAWEADMSGRLGPLKNDRMAAALALDFEQVGMRSYAKIADAKAAYDRTDQKDTLTQYAEQTAARAISLAGRTGRVDLDEIQDQKKELDSVIANLLADQHITTGTARNMKHKFATSVAMAAGKYTVEQAYHAGKTALGPGNIAAAQKEAERIAWELSEIYNVNRHDAWQALMTGAQQQQQIKQAVIGEQREAKAMAAMARAETARTQHEAAERFQFERMLDAANGTYRPLVKGEAGEDQIEGGDRASGTPYFKSYEDLVKRFGHGGAARLIEADMARQKQLEREARSEQRDAQVELSAQLGAGSPVMLDDGKWGFKLPNGRILDPRKKEEWPEDELTRAIIAREVGRNIGAHIQQLRELDEKEAMQRISNGTAVARTLANKIDAGQDKLIPELLDVQREILEASLDPGLDDKRRTAYRSSLTEVTGLVDGLKKKAEEFQNILHKVAARTSLTGKEAGIYESKMGLQLRDPAQSADPKAAGIQAGKVVGDLFNRNMEISEENAGYLATVLQTGFYGGRMTDVDLRKAWQVIDTIETSGNSTQRAAFHQRMAEKVAGWTEIYEIAKEARKLQSGSMKTITQDGRPIQTPNMSYGQAYKESRAAMVELAQQPTMLKKIDMAEATDMLSWHANKVMPALVESTGWGNWIGWWLSGFPGGAGAGVHALLGTKLNVPPQASETFTRLLEKHSRIGDGRLSEEGRTSAAFAEFIGMGFMPTKFGTPDIGKPAAQRTPVWKEKPIEWHGRQQGYDWGVQALSTFGAVLMADLRNMKAEDAWKTAGNGGIDFIQKDNGSVVNVIVREPLPSGGPAVPRFLRDRDGSVVEIDIASPEFRSFYGEFARLAAVAADKYTVSIPITPMRPYGGRNVEEMSPSQRRALGLPRDGAQADEQVRARLPDYDRVMKETFFTVPFGRLLMENIVEPGSGSGARAAYNRVLRRKIEQRDPNSTNIRGDAGNDMLDDGYGDDYTRQPGHPDFGQPPPEEEE